MTVPNCYAINQALRNRAFADRSWRISNAPAGSRHSTPRRGAPLWNVKYVLSCQPEQPPDEPMLAPMKWKLIHHITRQTLRTNHSSIFRGLRCDRTNPLTAQLRRPKD